MFPGSARRRQRRQRARAEYCAARRAACARSPVSQLSSTFCNEFNVEAKTARDCEGNASVYLQPHAAATVAESVEEGVATRASMLIKYGLTSLSAAVIAPFLARSFFHKFPKPTFLKANDEYVQWLLRRVDIITTHCHEDDVSQRLEQLRSCIATNDPVTWAGDADAVLYYRKACLPGRPKTRFDAVCTLARHAFLAATGDLQTTRPHKYSTLLVNHCNVTREWAAKWHAVFGDLGPFLDREEEDVLSCKGRFVYGSKSLVEGARARVESEHGRALMLRYMRAQERSRLAAFSSPERQRYQSNKHSCRTLLARKKKNHAAIENAAAKNGRTVYVYRSRLPAREDSVVGTGSRKRKRAGREELSWSVNQ